MESLSDEQAHAVYTWVDTHTLSRPKRNISRDFADGVLVAEILRFHFPQFVDLHNYVGANSQKQKVENWLTMKHKIFRKLNMDIDPKDLTDIANAVPGAIERFLLVLMERIPAIKKRVEQRRSQSEQGHIPQQQQQQQQQQPQHHQQPHQKRGPSAGAADHSTGGAASMSASVAAAERGGNVGASHHGGASVNSNDSTIAKDHEITNLRESVRLLTAKIRQMEELIKLRDAKIRDLQDRVVQLQS